MTTIALGLGSNLGNRLLNLRTAMRLLKEHPRLKEAGLRVTSASDVFETAPWGVADQPYFLNACLLLESAEAAPANAPSAFHPEMLLKTVKEIEADMGRTETRPWGERLIDIDILLMDSCFYESPALRIPHIDMHRRGFVLIPLAQLLPNWFHAGTERTVAEMARDYPRAVRICAL